MRMCKTIGIFLSFFFVCTSLFAQPRVLVVYYSRDGHTKSVGEKLAEVFDADQEALGDTKKRIGGWGTFWAGKDALAKKQTKLAPLANDPAYYDVILIGTPAWFSNMTPAVRTFITDTSFSSKTVGLFSTCHKVGADKAIAQMAELLDDTGAAQYPQLPLTHVDLEEENISELINEYYKKIKDVYAQTIVQQ